MSVAVAVAAFVDGAASRAREARRASQEAELLALFSGWSCAVGTCPPSGTGPRDLLAAGRQPAADEGPQSSDLWAHDPCVEVDAADTAIKIGDDEFWMLMAGQETRRQDRRVLGAVATQAAGLVKQRELTEEAGKAEAIAQADELRRSLLSAVSHDLRTPLAAAKAAVSSLRSDDIDFSAEDTAELLATVEESIDQLTALVGNLLDSSRLAAGVVRRNCAGYTWRRSCSVRCWESAEGIANFGRTGLDRVKVEVGDAVAMADSGLLERVLANLIDNALRYAPDARSGSMRARSATMC